MSTDNQDQDRWAIILAGGEGKRLSSLTQRIAGDARPKQFCSIIGAVPLIEQTRERVSLAVANEHILTILTRAHERYYAPILGDTPRRHLVIQPENRGTATAIIYALLRLSKLMPDANAALFPSDHFVSNERQFMRHVDAAFGMVGRRPQLVVLLGITAETAETSYGWIEPGQPVITQDLNVFEIREFWEKPSAELAQRLLDRGCLWNSFIMVGRVTTLLELIMLSLPDLFRSFARVNSMLMTSTEERAIEKLYASLPNADFSRDVLARRPVNLAVLPVRGCAWSDLGEPERVIDILNRQGIHLRWNAA